MHDEFRGSLARQGITEEAYLKATEKTGDDLHADFRPNAEKRVTTLLVLSKVADAEGVEVPDADVDAEVAQGRDRYAGDPSSCRTSNRSAAARSSAARCGAAGSSSTLIDALARRPPRASAAAPSRGRAGLGGQQRAGPGQRQHRRDRPGHGHRRRAHRGDRGRPARPAG